MSDGDAGFPNLTEICRRNRLPYLTSQREVLLCHIFASMSLYAQPVPAGWAAGQ
ncbi:hypothetical protein [Salibaculum griseiflavum]|uniref:hypothetical protein n=1 Tax=Salibaculum griseiflavum TaxID=1914409 RepID=UPI001C38DCFD|nr:hypothetical protein [Salibaculum griseiflavum]